ncbi:MAG: transposase [Pseudomonas sp.]|nr:transposase [Pseudomonas sp.]
MSNVRVTRPYRKRRQYTPEFKAQLVAESQILGASVSRIALDNDLNANLLRRWINESKQADQQPSPAFVPINLPVVATPTVQKSNSIRIEIPRAGGPIVIEWPAEQAHQCALCCNDPYR